MIMTRLVGPGAFAGSGQETPHTLSCSWVRPDGAGGVNFDVACGDLGRARWRRGEWPKASAERPVERVEIGAGGVFAVDRSGGVVRSVLAFDSARRPGCGVGVDGDVNREAAEALGLAIEAAIVRL
jgi:hypothetical protein